MRASTIITLFATLLISASVHVSAHGLVTECVGGNGVKVIGMGVIEDTPRDCTQLNPCQRDSSIMLARNGGCGLTLAGGRVNVQQEIRKAMTAGGGQLPTPQNGVMKCKYHQVNADGGGPLTASVDTTGRGNNFQTVKMIKNIAGRRGVNRAGATTTNDIEIDVSGMECTGGENGKTCVMKIRNAVVFGECDMNRNA
ncbi:hypothetical protein BJ742DRAFT_900561 [Cladochytrium replicatum]|nr:hypothetical protein BJ742DRAFT_900561 [Cladochytrium replicatum]